MPVQCRLELNTVGDLNVSTDKILNDRGRENVGAVPRKLFLDVYLYRPFCLLTF